MTFWEFYLFAFLPRVRLEDQRCSHVCLFNMGLHQPSQVKEIHLPAPLKLTNVMWFYGGLCAGVGTRCARPVRSVQGPAFTDDVTH